MVPFGDGHVDVVEARSEIRSAYYEIINNKKPRIGEVRRRLYAAREALGDTE